ncbi:hypothetical protein EDB81DRAFT_753077 [Dactylonectria macrodidyma]|uniref:Gcp-like domain-containing protein n=1 Tax=Dactylonectria macrodidyma TaxID=307937 RepID=A0A9P9FQ86_9HYPO|nr:hypothetical protein EDB81DRAFT_753077 [Dactylonectria macrodidyma]
MNASASASASASPRPPPYTASRVPEREDWEDWEDDEPITPIDAGEQVFIGAPPPPVTSTRKPKLMGPRASRTSVIRMARKSRHRQRTQNAKAGISLITDMAAFRRQTRLLRTPDGQPVKFVDAAALKALEGEPSSTSVGNWGWFSKNKMSSPATASPQQSARSPDQALSPEDRPIVIGISLSSDEMTDREVSPQTATTLQTPLDLQQRLNGFPTPPSSQPLQPFKPAVIPPHQSVWSPDTPTPDTASSFSPSRYTSSMYSQAPHLASGSRPTDAVPPVPTVPANFKKSPHQRLISLELGENAAEESESGTPCTLFEEDGTPSPQKQVKGKAPVFTPDSAGSKSHGWWDHVVTPFVDKRLSFASRRKMESPREGQEEWWNGSSSKPTQTKQHLSPTLTLGSFQTPIVRAPTPRRTPSPQPETTSGTDSGPSTAVNSLAPAETFPVTEKPGIIVTDEVHTEQPPPYSPPKKHDNTAPVRYRAVFPQGHPLNVPFPPSPGPISPGLSATMTSQGATPMTEIPLTPGANGNTPQPQLPLPLRPLGTFVPHSHSQETSGEMTRGERQRRRHEKEEVIARKAGGFWRGRGCIPKSGCFGRTGREGRQRRRVWMVVLGVILCVIILIVTLAVMLTRPKDSEEIPSIWVNLTDFPPMPTGVLTVVGPDNTIAKDSCTGPSTLWSCYLPKEQHDSVSPYEANQPTVIMQIQWDNSTRNTWNVSNGDAPTPIPRRSVGGAAYASSMMRERGTTEFNSNPDAPDYQEMFFLGNTTDEIQSDEKGGEPTPFYISLLDSLDSVDADELSKRALGENITVPPPDLNEDGTPKPAVLLPTPSQQPVRLYDRGLPTEHYGFYTYFKRTMFLKSVEANDTEGVPLDQNGGCRETEADWLTTWAQTRVLVQIWTQKLDSNTSTLLSSIGQSSINETSELIRPGTMPYPVTVTLDTHGGDPDKKLSWAWPIDDRQQVDEDGWKLLFNDIEAGGTLINPRKNRVAKYGGYDGGTGGCKCEWVNWPSMRLLHIPQCLPWRSVVSLTRGNAHFGRRSLVTLAIETSCDDTGVAILRHTPQSTGLLFDERISSDNRAFRGIHPLVAVRGHSEALAPLVRRALTALPDAEADDAGVTPARSSPSFSAPDGSRKRVPDLVAVTRGPGMRSNLGVGLDMAKGLAVAWGVPLVGVHHMQAHALTPRLARALGMSMGEARTTVDSRLPDSEDMESKDTQLAGPHFPFLSLLVSGGHTQLVHSAGLTEHSLIATTGDIAVGNLLDQTARDILPADVFEASDHVMYGRLLEAFAFPPPDDGYGSDPASSSGSGSSSEPSSGPSSRPSSRPSSGSHTSSATAAYDAVFTPAVSRAAEMTPTPTGYDWTIPLPFRQSRKLAFSFSSIYTDVHNIATSPTSSSMDTPERRALAQHTMMAAFTHLAGRLCLALEDRLELRRARTLVVAGGVASNRFLMHVLRRTLAARGFGDMTILAPPVELCTDNAAMIAWAGMEMYQAGYESELSITGIGRWPMDPEHGEGILGVDGWVKRETRE